jgi:hypothetical protein
MDLMHELPELLVQVVKSIKMLSAVSHTLAPLQNAGVISRLVRLFDLQGPLYEEHETDMENQLLHALHNLTRIDPKRQELAAQAGAISHLARCIASDRPLKQLALEMMMDFSHVPGCRPALWAQGGPDWYVGLLPDHNWAASSLEAVAAWLAAEPERVVPVLCRPPTVQAVVAAFAGTGGAAFGGLAEAFLALAGAPPIARALLAEEVQPPLVPSLLDRLGHAGHPALVRVNLLKTLAALLEAHPHPPALAARYDLARHLEPLAHDKLILIQGLAAKLLATIQG